MSACRRTYGLLAARGFLLPLAWAAITIIAAVTVDARPPIARPAITQGPQR